MRVLVEAPPEIRWLQLPYDREVPPLPDLSGELQFEHFLVVPNESGSFDQVLEAVQEELHYLLGLRRVSPEIWREVAAVQIHPVRKGPVSGIAFGTPEECSFNRYFYLMSRLIRGVNNELPGDWIPDLARRKIEI